MSEHAHTPGPWHVQGNLRGQLAAIVNQTGNTLAAAWGYGKGENLAEIEANMNLIAAAPDMVAALRKAEIILGDVVAYGQFPLDDPSDRIALDAVQDAIAKATGATP